jgi:hypothetical protein
VLTIGFHRIQTMVFSELSSRPEARALPNTFFANGADSRNAGRSRF